MKEHSKALKFIQLIGRSAIFMLLLYPLSVFSQHQLPYKIVGLINADTGTVSLEMVGLANLYPPAIQKTSTKVENGKFSFEGFISGPLGFKLQYGQSYLSDLFVIEPGTQQLSIDIKSNRETPVLDNQVMKERPSYLSAFEHLRKNSALLNQKYDSLNVKYSNKLPENIKLALNNEITNGYKENDKNLLKYVTHHPDSYYALWKFIHLSQFGYESVFDSIYNNFSAGLKKSPTGKVLAENLSLEGKLGIGKQFPAISPINMLHQKFDLSLLTKNQYTLIDFWYSNCGPCIAQFDDLKTIYADYRKEGFEIIAVSTDQKKNKENWLKVIKEYQLLWPQYWDVDGMESTLLPVTVFPTNFLINNQGQIVKKNIKPAQLREFLKQNKP